MEGAEHSVQEEAATVASTVGVAGPAAPAPGRPSPQPKPTYNAFISYSHAVDGRLAPALQAGLHQFAKSWYRLRALRVFYDESSLSANPALWPSIEEALGKSEFFILLASPEAAGSEWVSNEVTWWIANKERQNLLIAVTKGDIAWDGSNQDFDWVKATAIPRALGGALNHEPRFVDLRWAATEDHLSMRDPRFRDNVADLAATLRKQPKDDLVGEDIQKHRRAIRLARSAVALLAALAILAAASAVLAIGRQHQATSAARLATSRALAVTAGNTVDSQFDLSLLLAVEALRTRDTPEARAALFSALERNPQHVAFLSPPGSGTVTRVQLTPDGTTVAAGDTTGSVTLWRVADGTQLANFTLFRSSSVASLAVSPDASHVVAGSSDGTVATWDLVSGQERTLIHHDNPVAAVTFSDDGSLVASGDSKGSVLVADAATGRQVAPSLPALTGEPVDHLLFSADGSQVSVGGSGKITRWDLGSGEKLFEGGPGTGAHGEFATFSADLSLQAEAVGGGGYGVYVEPADDRANSVNTILPDTPESLAISPDDSLLAAAGQGTVRLFDTKALAPDPNVPALTGYPAAITSLSISANKRWLAAASGGVVVLSDLSRRNRIGRAVALPRDVCTACGNRAASMSPDGRTLAWVDSMLPTVTGGGPDGTSLVRLWDIQTAREIGQFPIDGTASGLSFEPDGQSIITTDPISIWDLQGHRLSPPVSQQLIGYLPSVIFSTSGRTLVLSSLFDPDTSLTRITVRDVEGGRVLFESTPAVQVPEAALSRRGILALAQSDGSIALLDVQTRRQVGRLAGQAAVTGVGLYRGPADALAFDSTGTQLASLASGTITVWDVAARRARFTLRWGGRGILRFGPDGSILVSGNTDGRITLWSLGSRQVLGTVQGQNTNGGFPDVVFSPDGTTFVSAVPGGGVMIWDLDPLVWRREACALAHRDLTTTEWRRYVGTSLAPRTACGR